MSVSALEEEAEVIQVDVYTSRKSRRSLEHERLWRALRRRWAVAGVLAAVTLAVLAPRLGAPGGGLRAEYTSWALVSYVHYSAGRRAAGGGGALWAGVRARARLHAVCVAHAHVVSPALAAALLTALTDGVDYRIVQGVLAWSCGGGCAWLSLSLGAGARGGRGGEGAGDAAAASALVYAASLLATPLHTALLCGRAALPALAGVVRALCTAAAPFALGVMLAPPSSPAAPAVLVQLAALVLLYTECCERFTDAEATLYLTDVLVAFALEVCCVAVSAAWCGVYARAGLLAPADARLVLACATPRSLDAHGPLACGVRGAGLWRLPAVFAAPAQAMLLTALVPRVEPQPAAPPAPSTSPTAP